MSSRWGSASSSRASRIAERATVEIRQRDERIDVLERQIRLLADRLDQTIARLDELWRAGGFRR